MSYSYEDTTWSESFNTFEGLENYLGTQPCQTANPYPPSQQLPPTASTSVISTRDYNASSSNFYSITQSSSLPSLSWSLDASSSNSYRGSLHNPYPPPFTTPLIEDDYTFFANVDLPPLDSNLFNVATNPQIPPSPGPEPLVRHVSPPSTKRPHTSEESEYPNKASNDAPFNHKRRKLSTNGDQGLPNVSPPTNFNNNSNVISDIFDNFNVPAENDNALANTDTSFLHSNLFVVTPKPSIPHAPSPVGHCSPPSGKRPYPNEEPDFHHISSNPNPKRRRRSVEQKHFRAVPPASHSYNNNSNVIPDIVHNYYVPAPTLSESSNTISLPKPYLDPNMFHHVPAPLMNILPAPPVTNTLSAHVPVTQPGSCVPSRAIDYSAGPNVYSSANLYTSSGGRNAFPSWDPLSYSTSFQPENRTLGRMTDLSDTENFLNATAVISSPPVQTLVPPFLGQGPSRVQYNNGNLAHTNAFANNATHSDVDICQHLTITNPMSKTGHTADARMPSTWMPSTRAASGAEPVLTFKYYQPPPLSPSSPAIPTQRPTKAPRKRCVPQPLPAMHFWERTDKGYRCLYDGPAAPGGCKKVIRITVQSSIKNLGRHMRIHACAEDKMPIPEAEKIALNSLPDSLREKLVACSLDGGELHHCAYFREHSRRWEEMTLERPDNLSRQHDRWNHPPHLWKWKKPKL